MFDGLYRGVVFHRHHQYLGEHAVQIKLANELEPQFRLIVDEAEYLQRLYKEGGNTQDAERQLSVSRTALTQLVQQLTPFEARDQGLAVLAKIDFWIAQNQQSRALVTSGGSGELERELRAYAQSLRDDQQQTFVRYLKKGWNVQLALVSMGVILLSLGALFFRFLNKGIWEPLERLQRHVEQAAALPPNRGCQLRFRRLALSSRRCWPSWRRPAKQKTSLIALLKV